MKKLLSIIFVLFLVSCGTPQNQPNQQTIKEKVIADSIAFDTKKRLVAEAYEKQRIEKESSLGIWHTNFYTDEFGDPTKQGYIGTSLISGVFSNSATENADLRVIFLISNPNEVTLQLYEYAGSNPVKAGVENGYNIRIKQDTLPPVNLFAKNYTDRLRLNKTDSKKLSDMFLKGGTLKISIVEASDYSQSKYYFEITDASGYKNALNQLFEKK